MKLSEAVAHFGTEAAMARKLGIKPQAVYQWDGKVPMGRQYQIQLMTKGKLKADPEHAAADSPAA